MTTELWLAFVVASLILLAIPGPTVMLVISYALSGGRATGWSTVPGVALGDLTAMTAALAGAGSLMATSATLFTLFKLAGALYLIWLAIKLWRAPSEFADTPDQRTRESPGKIFRNAFIVTALNPKGMVFFIAFVPQFVAAGKPLGPQFALLIITFVLLAAINVTLWVLLAGQLRAQFRKPSRLNLVNRVGAGFLLGAAVFTLSKRQ